jgi:hypothetical protein
MTVKEQYTPGSATGAQIKKESENWTLLIARELPHSPEKVWEAITNPDHQREWAPFESEGYLGKIGKVNLKWEGAPMPVEANVTRAESCKVLEYNDMRWELEKKMGGTKLTLWHKIDKRYISMGAAGWHICFDVLDYLLKGTPIGRMVGNEAMKVSGWQKLNVEYAHLFGVELPKW